MGLPALRGATLGLRWGGGPTGDHGVEVTAMGLRKRVARTAAAAALLAALATLGVGVRPQDHLAHAQGGRVIFNVDTTADTVDADPGNGTCADADGYCSLRAAIMEANAQAAQDASKEFVISLQSAAVYTLARDEDRSGHVVDSGADNDEILVQTTMIWISLRTSP